MGSNPFQISNQDRGVYYGNTLNNNKRWYFYKLNYKTTQTLTTTLWNPYTEVVDATTGEISYGAYEKETEIIDPYDYVSFGLGQRQTSPIEDLSASSYQNVQAYDICNKTSRKVYFNNVDVKDAMFSDYEYFAYNDYEFESPIYIFGHDTPSNTDDAIDARLRLFLIYDYILSIEDIDQIRKYAVLKGLLKYGEDDVDKFNVTVDVPYVPAYENETDWEDGGGYQTTM